MPEDGAKVGGSELQTTGREALSIYRISSQSLFALAKCWQFYTLDIGQDLLWGSGTWSPSLNVDSVLPLDQS
jgi:hypothetical protein